MPSLSREWGGQGRENNRADAPSARSALPLFYHPSRRTIETVPNEENFAT